MEARKSASDSDSIRVGARDLVLVLRLFRQQSETTLENIRLRICMDRKKPRRGEGLASTARDIAVELQKLGLVKGGPFPKAKSDYPRLRDKEIRITPAGRDLLSQFQTRLAEAYDSLFIRMFAAHRYLRDYGRVLGSEKFLLAPVLTSFKDHVASDYASAVTLKDEVMANKFRTSSLFDCIEKRLHRRLADDERGTIKTGIDDMLSQAPPSGMAEDATTFAKTVLSRLNDIVIPAVLSVKGLGFDFRTHRAIWSLGNEFLVWCATTSHPSYDGVVIFRTATLKVSEGGQELRSIEFEASSSNLRESFLERLYQTYVGLQKLGHSTLVSAQVLRAAFCLESGCQPSTFDKLFEEQYARDDARYEVHTEIQQQRPRHGTSLRAGNRNIGLVLISKK
jgi:hypothetical protein